jgi:beta-galactosidase
MDSPAVTVGKRGLRLKTEPELPLLSGAMHYFRVPRRSWPRCLDAFLDLGLTCVESYVPWVVHERERGRFDFGEGPRSPQGFERDLGAFLDACAERGLRVILRPGPHINAELTDFGYPARILGDPRCLAVGSRGNPVILPVPPRAFPVPSYASETFHREAATWLKGFGDFVLPWCWPDGPVVAVQVDNELSLFFRTGAYDQDYHPDAIALYRRFLARRHPEREGTELEELEPPRRFDASDRAGLARHLDWVAFKEWMVTRALSRLAGSLRVTGLDRVVLFHNFIAQRWGTPCSLAAAEETLDLAGLDVYAGKRDYAAVKHHALSLAGASRLPFVPELGCGIWPWWFGYTREDQRNVNLGLLMHGVKAFNLYMLVERDRWYGSPVGTDGQRRAEHFEEIRRLVAAVDPRNTGTSDGTEHQGRGTEPGPELGLWALDRSVEVGILTVRDYERLCLCSALTDPYPPVVLDLLGVGTEDVAPSEPTPGLDRPVAREYARVLAAAAAALDRLQVPYHHVDSELPADRLAPYRLLVVPSFAFIDAGLLERLAGWVASGGRLLLTPEVPGLDAALEPLTAPVPSHVLVGTEHLAERLAEQVEELGLGPAVRATGEVDLAVYHSGDRARVLFIANRTAEPQEGAVEGLSPEISPEISERHRAWDALGGQPFDLGAFHLEPFEVRMLRLREGAS